MHRFRISLLAIVISLAMLFSCAGVFKGMRSASTSHLNHAPYYAGKLKTTPPRIGHLPIVFDKKLQASLFDQDRKQVMQPVLDEMNAFITELGATKPLSGIDLPIDEAPHIYVGSEAGTYSPTHYMGDDESAPGMILYRYNASDTWKEALLQLADRENTDYILFVAIGFSDYLIHQKDLLGNKELQMGTGYAMPVKWLSDLETPAEVLHLSGALLDKNGKIIRAGAEGILAKPTGFWSSVFDLQDMLSTEDIDRFLNSERRQDLPDQPLTWQAALQNLVAQLTGKKDLLVE